jgi:UDP-3-O-[3-hydroxymyristoyl] glucosamine N-acyltransferase
MAETFTVAELVQWLGGEVEGNGAVRLVDVRGLDEAGPEHLSFLADPRYVPKLATTSAGAVLIGRDLDAGGRTVIRCADPYAAFAHALAAFHPLAWPAPGVDPRAFVAPDAEVEGATVEAFAWIGPRARIGAGSWIEAGAYLVHSIVMSDLPPGAKLAGTPAIDRKTWLRAVTAFRDLPDLLKRLRRLERLVAP